MCEATYSGCPSCQASTDQITFRTCGHVSLSYNVDSDGDPTDVYEQGDDVSACDDDGTLYCHACGHEDFEVEHDIVPEDCDCEECDPPAPDDPDAIVVLRPLNRAYFQRSQHSTMPPEVRALLERRSIPELPLRLERAWEIEEWLEGVYPPPASVLMREPLHNSYLSLMIPEPAKEAT